MILSLPRQRDFDQQARRPAAGSGQGVAHLADLADLADLEELEELAGSAAGGRGFAQPAAG
jgi:hypothetical protein